MGIWKTHCLVVRSGVLSLKNLPSGVPIKNRQLSPRVYKTVNNCFYTLLQEKSAINSKKLITNN